MKALFIGRFQPFHKGHLKVMQDLSKKYDEIIIGIGSSQYGYTYDNPFTADERIEMIKKTLEAYRVKNYTIVLIPDIHNPPKWVDHVKSIVRDFDVVITNNDFTEQLFKEKKIKVENTRLYNEHLYSGKTIRKKIRENKPWVHLVPEQVVEIIKKINGEERIKEN